MPREYSNFSDNVNVGPYSQQSNIVGPWPFGQVFTQRFDNEFQVHSVLNGPYIAEAAKWHGVEAFFHTDPTQLRGHLSAPDGEHAWTADAVPSTISINLGPASNTQGFWVVLRAFREVS